MPEDKRPCSGNSALRPAPRLRAGPCTPPCLRGAPAFPGESSRGEQAEIPPSTSAPCCGALLTLCYATQPSSKTPRNLTGVRLLLCSGVRSLSPAGLGRLVCCVFLLSRQYNRTRHSPNDLGDAVHEYTCSICQGTRSALVSTAAAGPHHGTACQFSVPEGGEEIK